MLKSIQTPQTQFNIETARTQYRLNVTIPKPINNILNKEHNKLTVPITIVSTTTSHQITDNINVTT